MGALREAFPDGRFNPGADFEAIAKVEESLGVALPLALKTLYLESDGFREPRGNSLYLMPLHELPKNNQFMWAELAASAPEAPSPDFRSFVFFGSSSGGHWWGIRHEPPHDIIVWHHHMLDEEFDYEAVGATILEVYLNDFAIYDELD